LSSGLIDYGTDEVSPSNFGLYLLTKSVLNSDFCGPQLSDLCLQPLALTGLQSDLHSDLVKGFFEFS